MKTTGRKWMRKRALSILMVCAMLFSGTELTALAAEPGVAGQINTQEEGAETTVPDELDGIFDSAEETEESNRPENPEPGTGEDQNPDTEEEPDDLDTSGNTEEGDIEESDQPDGADDITGNAGEETGKDVADETDTDEGSQEGDEVQPDDGESVSDNSVSENSISENSLVTVNGTNAFGRFFAEALSESVSEETENTDCDIYEITLNGTEAIVSFRAVESSTLVVGVYDEESGRLAATGSVEVNPEDTETTVSIETDGMPEYFVLRGFLVETESLRPLSGVYESLDYTRRMQEFYAKATSDFTEGQVLNLDEDTYNNFLVFSDNVKVIHKSENADVNKVIECDEENRSYQIENPNEDIASLSVGDIFAYYYDDNALIITKICSITSDMEGDKTVLTILGEDVDFNAVIEFIKVGAENPNGGGQSAYAVYAEPSAEHSKKWSIEDWSSSDDDEDGMSINLKDIGGESTIRLFRDWKNDIEKTELEISYGATVSVECKVSGKKRWKLGNPTMPTNIPGVILNCKIEVQLAGEVTGSYAGTLSGTVGVAIDEDGVQNISKSPEFRVSESVEAAISLGLVISPTVKFLHEKLLSAVLEVGGGVKVTAKIEAVILDTAAERHACESCLTVGIGPYVNITGKLTFLLRTKEVEMLDKDWTVKSGYYSVDYGQFGWGECPFKEYKTTVVVKTLSSQRVTGASVNNEVITDKNGAAKIWLPGGRQTIYATYNGKIGSKAVTIDGVKSVDVTLGIYANPGNAAVTQVCLGVFERSAAIMRDGSLYTWGSNVYGSLGTGGTDDMSIPTKVLNNVKTVLYSTASNTRVSAAITRGDDLYTWGQNNYGALGNGSTDNLYIPEKILSNVKSVRLGYFSGAAVTTDGQLYIWGALGDQSPARILEDEIIADVCLGVDSSSGYSAALTKDGKLYMWGCNVNGELGNGKQSTVKQNEPIRILENEKIKQVALSGGRAYSAAITEDGQLYMWGYNKFGQLGNGTTATQTEPVKVLEGMKVKEIAVGNTGDCYHSAAITEDGQLYMWGRNTYGQLGNGNTDDRTVPVKIDGIGKVKHVCISSYHTAAITEDGQLYMWGRNNRGQLGDGSTEDKYTPVKILEDVVSVDVQDTYSAAVTADGSLWMWGYNNNGQLGNGEESFRAFTVPGKVNFPAGDVKTVQSTLGGDRIEGEETLAFDDGYVLTEKALASKEAAYVYETLLTSSYPENAPVLVTDAENPLKQTADFSGLKSQEIYNVYVMKAKDSVQRLSQDNLLYIMQAVSGADGSLSVTYEMKEACEQPDVFCVGMTRTDLSAADAVVPDIVYDGEEHVPQVEVTINGRTLIAGTDYEIYGDCIVSEIGEYKIGIKGIGIYCGEREATFRVVTETTPEDPDDPIPDPAYGDVLPEDIPADGVIPEGLWIAGVAEAGYDYTGKVIKPEVRVYDHKTLLKEKTDYTIAYKNNTKAYCYTASDQEFAANKAPTITVTGKGNYIGKETQTFTIRPLDISVNEAASDGTGTEADSVQLKDNVFAADNMTIAANKKNQKPIPVLLWNDKKLKNNTDYMVTYYDSTGAAKLDYVKEAGSYYIELAGKGNFTGTRRINLTVTGQSDQLKLMSKMTVAKIMNQAYTGSAVRPALTVKDGKTTLKEGEHYTVSYSRNTEVGTAYAVVTGIEDKGYSGTKRVSFKIMGGSVSKAIVKGLTGQTFLYSGMNQEPELTVSVKTAGVEKMLQKGTDYKLMWQKNCDAGTATVTITGMGGYTGTLKKTFKIQAFDIAANADGRFTAALAQEKVPYAKGGTKPEVSVTFLKADGSKQKLAEGKDYTLICQNHTAPNDGSKSNKIPTVIIKGKGNFRGTYGTKLTYMITTQDLGAEGIQIAAADKTYQNKKNIYATKVTITDLNGKALKAGTDYNKAFAYTYKNDTTLDNGTVRAAGTTVDKNDIISAGTVLTVTVNGKGNYTGSITGEYRITQAAISSASVTIPKQTYTGAAITLDKSQITVKVKGRQVDEDQYEIVSNSYKNNVKKGTASVTIRGVDNYGGTKTVKFTIRAKGFLWWWR